METDKHIIMKQSTTGVKQAWTYFCFSAATILKVKYAHVYTHNHIIIYIKTKSSASHMHINHWEQL